MVLRRIIIIDENKCDGCGLCSEACHEGAIGIVDGKARLLRDDFCDGLGACLPVCPTGAISFEEREAAAFDEESVLAHKEAATVETCVDAEDTLPCGCPSSETRILTPPVECSDASSAQEAPASPTMRSQLAQWPTQIKLVPATAPFLNDAKLLIAADCCAYANADFHNRFMKGHITLIGCPKLDGEDYSQKLTDIIRHNNIKSVMVVRMEVPCCGGIVSMVQTALVQSGKMIPWRVVNLATNGAVIEE